MPFASRTCACARIALAFALPTLPAAAADFPHIGDLAQEEFRDLSRDLGSAFSYKGITPATPLGLVGFDVGIEVTQTRFDNSRLFSLAGAGSESSVVIPKLHLHKGLPYNFDISAFVASVQEFDASLYGGAIRWAFVDDGLVYPAFGIRLSGTRANGLGALKVSTAAVDLLVSKKFTLVTPYIGAGTVRTQTSASGTSLREERTNEARAFGGVNINVVAANFAFEAEKMGDNVSLSAKVGWRF